ncbi:uncharacterized protein LOC128501912 [Spea bombifrons]|uniref:uncharacterized protein LOC128501912 n=1 Tax=Spea bombifrons TaxID=233779 RepID=UPI00234BC75F|nr:uncharacterized protein LOC128501912 [Spea bombifrons]
MERADRQVNNYDGSLGDNDIQSTSTRNTHNIEEDGSSCHQSSRAAHISGMYDGDESSYMSDTSDGEFLFSDTSLAISLSENESDFIVSLSRSGSVRSQSEDTAEEDDLRRRIRNPIQKRRKSRQDGSRVFQRALDMIKNQDMTRLRDMCQHNFFHLSCTDKEGKTLLHHAATHGSEHTCQVLLDSNVGLMNINKQDIFGKTALHYAMQTGNNKTIKLLLIKGAKSAYEIQNSSGPCTLEDTGSMRTGLS